MATASRKASSSQTFEIALLTFLAEQHPFILPMARIIVSEAIAKTKKLSTAADYLKLAGKITSAIKKEIQPTTKGLGETTSFVSAKERMSQAMETLLVDLQGFCQRYALLQSFSSEEKKWMLRGILLTRAVDNQMKKMFLTGEVEYEGKGVQGKGKCLEL